MKQDYKSSLSLLRGQVLSDLMLGGKTKEQIESDLMRIDIQIEEANMRVISFIVTSFEEELIQSSLILITIEKIIETTVKDLKEFIVFHGVDNEIYLILHTSDKKSLDERVYFILEEIKKNIMELLSFHVSIGIGGWVHGMSNLHISYEESKRALNDHFLDKDVHQ